MTYYGLTLLKVSVSDVAKWYLEMAYVGVFLFAVNCRITHAYCLPLKFASQLMTFPVSVE